MKGLSASIGGVQVGSQQAAKTAASARPAAETQTRHAAAVTGSRRATPGDLGAAHGGRTECGRAIGRADGLPGGGRGLTLGLGPNVEFVFKDILNIVYCSPPLLLLTLFRWTRSRHLGPK